MIWNLFYRLFGLFLYQIAMSLGMQNIFDAWIIEIDWKSGLSNIFDC